MIFLEVDGKRYENFESASVSFSMDAFARDFRFTASATGGNPLPFKGGEACKVFVDDDQVLNGFIDIVDGNYDGRSHNIEILGRGRAADVADSTIDNLELSPEISLKVAVEEMIKGFGSDVKVNDLVGDLELFNIAEDKIGASPGDGGFDFIETLARKRQVLLNENGEGDIDITRGRTEKYQQKLQNLIYSDSNNIKRSGFSYDLTGIYKNYIVRSQQNTTSINFSGDSNLNDVVSQLGTSTDDSVRTGRQLAFVAEKASSNAQLNDRAIWESNIRRARSRLYNVTFVGHKTKHDEQWIVNKLISVNDEFAGIKEDMLINSLIFIQSSEGNLTEIGLIDKNAYTPNPADSLSETVGQEFVF